MEFVQSSQSMIERGDPEAIAVFEEYSNLPMPDPPLSEAQIRDVLAYVRTAADAPPATGGQPAVAATPNAAAVTPPAATDPEVALPLPPQAEITRGQDLFQGRARFENGGPTCNSCHEVVNDAVIGGGILSV